MVLSTSLRQSTMVLLCLCTALWSTLMTLRSVLKATYLQCTYEDVLGLCIWVLYLYMVFMYSITCTGRMV